MAKKTPTEIGNLVAKHFSSAPALTGQMYSDGSYDKLSTDALASAVAFYDTAIAICLAESGGETTAKNAGSSASGLWQIMTSVHKQAIADAVKWQSSEKGKKVDIFDPDVNTIVADMVYQGAGNKWTPWEAFNTGAYKKHLGHGKAALAALTSDKAIKEGLASLNAERDLGVSTAKLIGVAAPGASLISAADAALNSSPVQAVLAFVKDAGMTVGVFILGLIMVILGIWFVLSQTQAGALAKKTPIGKALS